MSDTRLERHRARYERSRPVVFCVKCGSTLVDQVALDAIKCGECDAESPWDGTTFSIRRYDGPEGETDVNDALRNTPKGR